MTNKQINRLVTFLNRRVIPGTFKWFETSTKGYWKYEYEAPAECSCCKSDQLFSCSSFTEDEKMQINMKFMR